MKHCSIVEQKERAPKHERALPYDCRRDRRRGDTPRQSEDSNGAQAWSVIRLQLHVERKIDLALWASLNSADDEILKSNRTIQSAPDAALAMAGGAYNMSVRARRPSPKPGLKFAFN